MRHRLYQPSQKYKNILVKRHDQSLLGKRIDEIDLSRIESALNLKTHTFKHADCYIRMNGLLVIDIAQKTPVLRVMPNSKNRAITSIENGDPFPFVGMRHTADVKVATGHINAEFEQ